MSSLRWIISGANSLGNESIAHPSSAVPRLTSIATGKYRLERRPANFGTANYRAGIRFQRSRQIGDGFHTA